MGHASSGQSVQCWRFYRQPKVAIRDAFLSLIELSGIVLPGKRRLRKVFDLYVDYTISFADAYHAVLMEQRHLQEIISFDRDFDKLTSIQRAES